MSARRQRGKRPSQEEVDAFTWFHGIYFGSARTLGRASPPNWSLYGGLRMLEHIDLNGCRVLDVGTMDGLISFIAEDEGALEVHATDLYDRPSFLFARDALESDVQYHPRTSVEDLVDHFGRGYFDLVVMGGLMYHLVSPFRSLLIARALLRNSGLLLLETVTAHGDEPTMVFNPAAVLVDEYTTYFVPTESCVVEMMRFCLLDVISIGSVVLPTFSRTSYLARALTPETATYSTDLMRRAQERARRSTDDRVLDELSFARLVDYDDSSISVEGLERRFTVPTATFTCRFGLQPRGASGGDP
jgi:tRNA (mo5U34)-methyltransferase